MWNLSKTENGLTSAATDGGMSGNWIMALLNLGRLINIGGREEVPATGVKIAEGGVSVFLILLGCRDGAFRNAILRSARGLNRLPTPFRGRGIVKLVIIFNVCVVC